MESKEIRERSVEAGRLLAMETELVQAGGDITKQSAPVTTKLLSELMRFKPTNAKDKLNGYGDLIQSLEYQCDGIGLELKDLKKRVAHLTAQIDARQKAIGQVKEWIKEYLQKHELEKVSTGSYEFAVVKNGGTPPVIFADWVAKHPEELPEGYRRVVFQPDKVAVRVALQNGEDLDFAELGEVGTHLKVS